MGFSLPHGLPDAPGDVLGDGLTFGLGKGSQQSDNQLTVRFQSVDILLLEDYPNAQPPEDADVFQTVYCIPGEPGDGFRQHQVHLNVVFDTK